MPAGTLVPRAINSACREDNVGYAFTLELKNTHISRFAFQQQITGNPSSKVTGGDEEGGNHS